MYNCKQKNRLSLSVKYIFFINGIDSKVVAPCVCMFEQCCPTHTNSGKSEKSIIVVQTPPKQMVSSRGSGVWASLVGGPRMCTIEMKYENTPFCRCESHGFGDSVLLFWVPAPENTVKFWKFKHWPVLTLLKTSLMDTAMGISVVVSVKTRFTGRNDQ